MIIFFNFAWLKVTGRNVVPAKEVELLATVL